MSDALWLLGMTTILWGWMFWQRRTVARRDVGRLVDRAGLPTDQHLISEAERRFSRRHGALAVGACIGGAAGTVPYGLLDATPAALAWWAALSMVGMAIAACAVHFGTLRSRRRDGQRAASLRQRRLLDFLTPTEVSVQYGLLVLPLVTGGLGVYVLTGNDHPRRGWALVAAAVGAVLVVIGTLALAWVVVAGTTGRKTLGRSQQVIG